ncbi:MAG: tetratricopeptide repeat protein [Acidimicrobiia bacterium]
MAVHVLEIPIEGDTVSDRTRQQIELLHEELEEIDEQVRVGDLDDTTGSVVRERYEAELAALEASSVSADTVSPDDGDAPRSAAPRRWLSGRTIVGVSAVVIAIVGIGFFGAQSLSDRRIVGADGVVRDVVSGNGSIDLESVSEEQMEEIVAENPGIIPMRLALARRYFEAGQFDKALDHYFEVLNREQHPEALANVGWMTYLSDRPDIAVSYVEAALDREPNYLAAEWYLGNIYVSLGRNDEAAVLLVKVASSNEIPDDVKEAALTLLAQIKADG